MQPWRNSAVANDQRHDRGAGRLSVGPREARTAQECRMIGSRIEPVTCPECGLRARVRARPSGSPESFVDDNISKCFHARNGTAVLDCPSLKPQLLRADRA